MFGRSQKLLGPIGLDIGAQSIRVLQLRKHDERLVVHAAARRELSEPVGSSEHDFDRLEVVDAIRQMLRQNNFSGRQVVTPFPRDLIYTRTLRMPSMPANELAQAVQFEAEQHLPYPVADASIFHMHAGEIRQSGESRTEVILAAALNQSVERFLDMLTRCGLVAQQITFEPQSLLQSVCRLWRRQADANRIHVLLDIGHHTSRLLMARGRQMMFFKTLDVGSASLSDAMARRLGVSPAEAQALRMQYFSHEADEVVSDSEPLVRTVKEIARVVLEPLAREVAMCLRYYSVTFRGSRPDQVLLCGGESECRLAADVLTAELPLPVVSHRPMVNVDLASMARNHRRGPLSSWSLAAGLATVDFAQAREELPPEVQLPDAELNAPPAVPLPVAPASERRAA